MRVAIYNEERRVVAEGTVRHLSLGRVGVWLALEHCVSGAPFQTFSLEDDYLVRPVKCLKETMIFEPRVSAPLYCMKCHTLSTNENQSKYCSAGRDKKSNHCWVSWPAALRAYARQQQLLADCRELLEDLASGELGPNISKRVCLAMLEKLKQEKAS